MVRYLGCPHYPNPQIKPCQYHTWHHNDTWHTPNIWRGVQHPILTKKRFILFVHFMGQSEPAATSAPVQDEAIQAILEMNQKHILFPCQRDFSAPFFASKFSPPTYFLPPSLLPPSPHFLLIPSLELRRALELEQHKASKKRETQGLKKVESSTLKECGEEKTGGVFHPKCRSKRKKVSSLLSLHFFSSLWFFFSLCFSFFLMFEIKKMPRRKRLKRKGKNKRPKVGAKSEWAEQNFEGKLLSFFAFFFFLWFFFFLFEKKKMLGESV